MIIRRIRSHISTQNWSAILVDIGVVVVGVFLGIQAQDWVDERNQSNQQSIYLDRLEKDFESIRRRLEEHFAVYDAANAGADFILSLIRMSEDEIAMLESPLERISRAINPLSQQRIPPQSSATYLEMRADGQLSMVGNPSLRDKLAEYDQALDIMREVARMSVDSYIMLSPALYRCLSTGTAIDENALSGIRTEVIDYDLECMRTDKDFEVAVTVLQRNALNSLMQRRLQVKSIEDILGLVQAEQNYGVR